MPVNTLLLTASVSSIPLALYLNDSGQLSQIIIPAEYKMAGQLFSGPLKDKISFCNQEELVQYCSDSTAVTLICFGYPFKLPANKFKQRCLNIHFGPLPENRGPDPIFWTLKEGKTLAHITIHMISDEFDSGDIVAEKTVTIFPGENYGLLSSRLGHLTVDLVKKLLEETPALKKQDQHLAVYKPRPAADDFTITWDSMSAKEIEQLVNACNPKYGGAICRLNGAPLKILEVSYAQLRMPEEETKELASGTIVHANENEGLFVICGDSNFLRLDILALNEGTFTGMKMVRLGVTKGIVLK